MSTAKLQARASKNAGPHNDLENDAAALSARMRELQGLMDDASANVTHGKEKQRLARDLAVIERVIGRQLAKNDEKS